MWGWVLGPWAEWIGLSWTDSGLRAPESSLPTNRWGCDPTQLLLGMQYPITGVSRLVGGASSVQFSWVQSLSYVLLFVIHGLQHARLPCSSPTPGPYSNSCPLSGWCHPTISSYIVPFSCFHLSQHQPKYWSFNINISPSNEHLGLISFRMDCLDLLVVQGTLKVFSNTTVQKHQFFTQMRSKYRGNHHWQWKTPVLRKVT